MGSATVLADGSPLSFTALPVLGCQDIGMISPIRLKNRKNLRHGVAYQYGDGHTGRHAGFSGRPTYHRYDGYGHESGVCPPWVKP